MKLHTGRVTAKKTARAPLHENNHVRKTTAPAIAPIPKTGSQIRSKISTMSSIIPCGILYVCPLLATQDVLASHFLPCQKLKLLGVQRRSFVPAALGGYFASATPSRPIRGGSRPPAKSA